MMLVEAARRASGQLVPITGTSARLGAWAHVAFVPDPLPHRTPVGLTVATWRSVADARAALAALDTTSQFLPNPGLLRQPALRREAQSTSALEGTFAPLVDVLGADDEDDPRADGALREVVNYIRTAAHAFDWAAEGRPLTLGLLDDLQRRLVSGTSSDGVRAGRIRDIQVAIGATPTGHPRDARFVPPPPGPALEASARDLLGWMRDGSEALDPLVAAALAHYQFETLHPYTDGNGRMGRLLILLQLLQRGVLQEPMLTVSPWFEARRGEYYDRLFAVSTDGDWDGWIHFFGEGLLASAVDTRERMLALVAARRAMTGSVRAAGLRADNATRAVDFALAQPVFAVRQLQRHLGVTYARANGLVAQLVRAGVLTTYDERSYDRRFVAPQVLEVLLRE